MRARSVAAVTVALALTACSPSHVDNPTLSAPPSLSPTATAGQSAGATGAQPCSLVTAAQITRAFGGTTTAGTTPPGASRPECAWHVTGSNLGSDGTVMLFFPPVQSRQAFEQAKTARGAVAYPELGADAFYRADVAALTVLVDSHQFTVQATGFAGAKPVDLEADLGAIARDADAAY